ncbi:hypothetical protein [Halopenitus persicus]|uniref:hypothetical protein n=1 Tax=Halopenitus persicus TaxID=1048396 RepID=UPI001E435257|nr:hypothetical protein [Halopenitus persicus]
MSSSFDAGADDGAGDVETADVDGVGNVDVADVDGVEDVTDVETVATSETVATAEIAEGIASASREDLRLALIPILFVGIYGGGRLAMDPAAIPAASASLACGLLIADGLFWHSPRDF